MTAENPATPPTDAEILEEIRGYLDDQVPDLLGENEEVGYAPLHTVREGDVIVVFRLDPDTVVDPARREIARITVTRTD